LNFSGGCSQLGLNAIASVIHKSKLKAANAKIQITRLLEKLERLKIILFNAFILAVVALNLDLCIKKARALNKMISKHLSFRVP
jgi:hypothetical protein